MRIPRAAFSLLFVAAMGAVVLAMVLTSFGYTRSARTAPLVVGLPTAAFIAIQLVRDGVAMARGDRVGGTASEQEADRYASAEGRDEPADSDLLAGAAPGAEVAQDRNTSALGAMLWVLGLAILIYVVGMFAAIPVFTAVFMRLFGGERWAIIAWFAGGTTAFVYVFFVVVLEIRLYQGLLGEYLPF
jgi:hypothetical protein